MLLSVIIPLGGFLFVLLHPSGSLVPAWRLYAATTSGLAATALAVITLILYRRARASLAGLSLRASLASTLGHALDVELQPARLNTIAALSAAIEARTKEPQGHNLRVSGLAVAIGRELALPEDRLAILARAALLHDIGKLGVPEALLHKPEALSELDWALLRTHPEMGSKILEQLGDMEAERQIVAAQQERLDGSGYPLHLKGEAIPLEARILAAVSTYEALLSPHPYRTTASPEQAVTVLLAERAKTLDPACVDALLRLLAGTARASQP